MPPKSPAAAAIRLCNTGVKSCILRIHRSSLLTGALTVSTPIRRTLSRSLSSQTPFSTSPWKLTTRHRLPYYWTSCASFSTDRSANMSMNHVERITEQLEKPELDDRSYRVIRLGNKLEALLVHDPDTDKASAAVNVNVGNFSDADDMPGMAHAVEHLLFMGTEKYPKENAYNQYLAAHSGSSNAYTAASETNYFFEVAATAESSDQKSSGQSTPATASAAGNGAPPEASQQGEEGSSATDTVPPLYGALDRFAQFFVAPLFLESTLDRELKAVDSENKKNLQSDSWRLMQLHKSLSNPGHPYHHFSTGNLQTLKEEPLKRGLDVRSEFIKFYEKHYSANRMKLAVLGRESLDQLEQWVVELFSDVRNKDLPQNRWDDIPLLTEDNMCTQIFAKPVMDTRVIDIYFPFIDQEDLYESQPSRYISHLIGHEGPGSILAYIKAKGWASSLSSGAMPVCPGSAFFTISVGLTEQGLKQYREVVNVIFQYIALIKEREPEQWIFDEMKNLAEVDFRFRQKTPASRFTSRLSSVMQKPLPREWLLSGSLLRKFNPEAVKEGLACLRADRFRLILISQEYPGDWDMKEKWYGTEYKIEKIPEDFLGSVRQALSSTPETRLRELHMPNRNEFIPTRLSVEKKEVSEPAKTPKLLRHDERVHLWYKKDDRFWVPKATLHITLRSPLVIATIGDTIKSRLYCELVRDNLVEYAYDAELAGLDYHLAASDFGLDVSVLGYNDKMPVLLEKVLRSMRDLVIDPDRFHIIKERMSRACRNAEYQQPFYQVGDYTRYLNAEKGFINEQIAAELEHVQLEDVASFFPQILSQVHIEVLAHGNLYKEDALRMTDLIESTLKPRPVPQSQWPVRRNVLLPFGSNYVYERTLKDPANVNNCIEYYLHVGSITERNLRAKLQLFAQMTDEPAFDQLRSKEQLGYVVWSGCRYSASTIGYRVIIQSERTARYLESRIESFLAGFAETLETMSDKDFEGHKRSVINRRLEKFKNLGSETSWYWTQIGSEYYEFLLNEIDAANVRTLTKSDVMEFYKQYIEPSSASRAKLSVYLNAQSKSPGHGDKAGLTAWLAAQVEAAGFATDTELLNEAFNNVDVSHGGKEQIVSALRGFMLSDLKLSEAQVTPVIDQIEPQLAQQLQTLGTAGTKEKSDETGVVVVNGTKTPEQKQVIHITNVRDFKSRLPLSAGPHPVVDLSEFEDFDAKL